VLRIMGALGRWGIGWLRLAVGMAELFQATTRYLVRWLTRRARLPRDSVAGQMVRVGVRSVPIVLMTNFFVGMILAVSIADLLRQYGQLMALPNIIGVAITRELAPLMTAIVMSGFVGAAMAAELGTMTVSEEILALETAAISPVRFLVLPRLLAVTAMLACLTIFADYAGVGGGYVIGVGLLHLSGPQYLEATRQAIYWRDILLNGLVKSEVFALIITVVACYQGLRVRGGAEGVGRATTNAVVHSIVLLIAANLVLAIFFNWVLVGDY
jgi:phospholipid/cholesterol/gamma-HCH transport system permease protein